MSTANQLDPVHDCDTAWRYFQAPTAYRCAAGMTGPCVPGYLELAGIGQDALLFRALVPARRPLLMSRLR